MFAPVLEGLCRLHARGIIHRDISPDNLMRTGDGAWKLIDFGAAFQIGEQTAERSGKIAYAPPECKGRELWAVDGSVCDLLRDLRGTDRTSASVCCKSASEGSPAPGHFLCGDSAKGGGSYYAGTFS